jgi:hypothetical protein
MESYRYKVPAEHLNVFATRNPTSTDLFIYCLSNRRLINNMHSSLEIEVLKWNEAYVGSKQEKKPDVRNNDENKTFRSGVNYDEDEILQVHRER